MGKLPLVEDKKKAGENSDRVFVFRTKDLLGLTQPFSSQTKDLDNEMVMKENILERWVKDDLAMVIPS